MPNNDNLTYLLSKDFEIHNPLVRRPCPFHNLGEEEINRLKYNGVTYAVPGSTVI